MKRCKRCGLYPAENGLNTCDACIEAIQNRQVPFGVYAREEAGVRQLIRDLRHREPPRESFRRWWSRERTGVMVGVLVVICGWLGFQQFQLERYSGQRRADRAANIQALCRSLGEITAYNRRFVAQFHVTYRGPEPLACAPLVARAKAGS